MNLDGKKYFNTKSLAEWWNCSKNSIYNYVRNGSIPFIRTPGGRIFNFPVDAIIEYESKQLPKNKKSKKAIKNHRKALSAHQKLWRAEL